MERKDSMEAELASLKDTLHKKMKDYEQELTDMDRQHIQDRWGGQSTIHLVDTLSKCLF